ncbi:hypothetical protein O4G76_19460 [Limimaricola sp. G21655-S1]|nr:hypothetical protein [Limimaricola sp. G21655-S1]
MEAQTLQQQVPVYHVCQQCNGAGCQACSDLLILDGDIQLDPEWVDELPEPSPINGVIGIKPAHVLCQDCLRVLPFTAARHNEDEFCVCGGQLCGCDVCNKEASLLLSGVRDVSLFNFRVAVDLSRWTAEQGLSK